MKHSAPCDNCRRNRSGFSLWELTAVVMILSVLAAIVIPLLGNFMSDSREDATLFAMREVQKTILNRYQIDMAGKFPISPPPSNNLIWIAMGLPGGDPSSTPNARPQLKYLFQNPSNEPYDPRFKQGWNGPYFLESAAGRYPGSDPNPDLDGPTRGFTVEHGSPGDPVVVDGWGNPIVIIVENSAIAYLVSAGRNGKLDSRSYDQGGGFLLADEQFQMDPNKKGDDLALPLK